VARLHHEHDERAPAPAERPPGTEKAQRMPHDAAEHHHWAGDERALPRERIQQERHEVAALAIGAELDVRVRSRMDARAYRHVVPGRARVVGERDGEDRLAVRSHQLTEAIAEQRERASLLALDEQSVRAERAGRYDDAARRERAALLRKPRARQLGRHAIAAAPIGNRGAGGGAGGGADRANVGYLAIGDDLGTALLREP